MSIIATEKQSTPFDQLKQVYSITVHQMSKEEAVLIAEVIFKETFQFTYDFQFMFLSYIVCHSETNLKVKQALTVTAELGEDLQKLTEFNGEYK